MLAAARRAGRRLASRRLARVSLTQCSLAAGLGIAAMCTASARWTPVVNVAEGPPRVAAPTTPKSIARKPNFWGLCCRAGWLFWCFLSVLCLAPLSLLVQSAEEWFYTSLHRAILSSRSAALVKWAQWAAVRPDIFPMKLCDLLNDLHARAPTHDLACSAQDLQDLGLALDGVQRLPFASGSIAQVHEALHEERRVAVKLRHPKVRETLLTDFELMRRAATVVDRVPFLHWVNAVAMVRQFEMAMEGQCDLHDEADSLDVFAKNFSRKPWIVFPRVVASSEAVLVETFETGDNVSEMLARKRNGDVRFTPQDADFLVTQGLDFYLQMLLVDNWIHADLHPGNMLFRGSSTSAGFPAGRTLVLLDVGMSKTLTDDERKNFIGVFQALGDGDGRAVSRGLLNFSRRQGCSNPAAFERDIVELIGDMSRGYGCNVNLGDVMRACLMKIRDHRVSVDGNYATLVANVMCLESMARQLNPSFNLLDSSYPLLRAHQLLGDETFRSWFSWMQRIVPGFTFPLMHHLSLYSGTNGPYLARFQI